MKISFKFPQRFRAVCKRTLFMLFIALMALGVRAEEEKITISFTNANIVDVVRWASDLTDKSIILDDKVKNQKVTVIAGDPVSRKDAYEAFLAILQVNDLAVVEGADTIKIFPTKEATASPIPFLADDVEGENQLVIQIVKVKNIAATQLINLLRPLVPNTAHLQAHPGANILLIADYKANVEKIVRLVEQLDKAGTIDIEVIKLQYASAKEVIDLISSLVPKIVAAEGGKGGQSSDLHFASDERSNSILMSGDPVLRSQMKKLIARLDQPLAGEGNTHVVYLNYADAKEMAAMLESISATVIETEKDTKIVAKEVSILAHEANNALVITAPPSILDTIKKVIDQLDVRREQVLVEAILVEIREGGERDFGVFWQSTPTSAGWQVGGAFRATDITPTGGTSPDISPSAGILAGYFREGDLRGVAQLLETSDDANVLSKPTIISLDNEEASILVGENVPFITGREVRDNDNDSVTITREDVGIELKIKPQINPGNTLTMEIEQKTESINVQAAQDSGAEDLITNKRELKTKVLVADKEILVLGGLVRDEVQETETKVPFLGDIPLIGWLFKGSQKQITKNNFMVFIKPTVLHTDEVSRHETEVRYNFMRQLAEEFNKDTDWLTLHPDDRPILDPLEATEVVVPQESTEESTEGGAEASAESATDEQGEQSTGE